MGRDEKTTLAQLHFMRCSKCGMDLHTIELHGISVDQCASFDRGEIEQMLRPAHAGCSSV